MSSLFPLPGLGERMAMPPNGASGGKHWDKNSIVLWSVLGKPSPCQFANYLMNPSVGEQTSWSKLSAARRILTMG